MRKLYDYDCPACGLFEAWASHAEDMPCPGCGVKAERIIGSKGVLLSFKDEGFPRAARMWAESHERAGRK